MLSLLRFPTPIVASSSVGLECLHRASQTPLRCFATNVIGDIDAKYDEPIVSAGKREISQSPWKMNFLVKLIRNTWVPDAIAQLKFSPKHRARDVSKVVKRACALAGVYHKAIPEELHVHEVMITKGKQQKRARIMGRGRTGMGYKRASHVNVKLAIVNFEARIKHGPIWDRKKWMKRYEVAKKARARIDANKGQEEGTTVQS